MAGQIIPRGESTWLVRVPLGRDPETGTRRYHNHTVHGTKKDAQRYLTGVLRDIDLGDFREPCKLTLNEYLDQWLETAARAKLSARTFEHNTRILALYVRPQLGSRQLAKLAALDVQNLYNQLHQERGLSPRTVRIAHNVLASALRQAVKWQMIPANPADGAELPRERRREMRALSPEEARRFLAATAGTRWAVLFELAIATGMRPGEVLGLQWKDVVWPAGAVQVRRVLVRVGKSWHFAEPKTPKSRRTIPLPASLVRALKSHRQLQLQERLAAGDAYESHDLVFAASKGEPLEEHNLVNRHFKPALKAAQLPASIRLYDLRHTCATLLLAAGENPKVVAERLGHASIVLTLDTYSHVLPTMQQAATERLEATIYGRG